MFSSLMNFKQHQAENIHRLENKAMHLDQQPYFETLMLESTEDIINKGGYGKIVSGFMVVPQSNQKFNVAIKEQSEPNFIKEKQILKTILQAVKKLSPNNCWSFFGPYWVQKNKIVSFKYQGDLFKIRGFAYPLNIKIEWLKGLLQGVAFLNHARILIVDGKSNNVLFTNRPDLRQQVSFADLGGCEFVFQNNQKYQKDMKKLQQSGISEFIKSITFYSATLAVPMETKLKKNQKMISLDFLPLSSTTLQMMIQQKMIDNHDKSFDNFNKNLCRNINYFFWTVVFIFLFIDTKIDFNIEGKWRQVWEQIGAQIKQDKTNNIKSSFEAIYNEHTKHYQDKFSEILKKMNQVPENITYFFTVRNFLDDPEHDINDKVLDAFKKQKLKRPFGE